MEKNVYKKPQFIEGLTFYVEPGKVDAYIQAEEEIWLDDLSRMPGFLGSETWVSEDKKGEVTTFYFWESEEAYKAIDPEFLAEHKKQSMYAVESEFVRAWHEKERLYRVREARV